MIGCCIDDTEVCGRVWADALFVPGQGQWWLWWWWWSGLEVGWRGMVCHSSCTSLAGSKPYCHFFSEKYYTVVLQSQYRSQCVPACLETSAIALSQKCGFQLWMHHRDLLMHPHCSSRLPSWIWRGHYNWIEKGHKGKGEKGGREGGNRPWNQSCRAKQSIRIKKWSTRSIDSTLVDSVDQLNLTENRLTPSTHFQNPLHSGIAWSEMWNVWIPNPGIVRMDSDCKKYGTQEGSGKWEDCILALFGILLALEMMMVMEVQGTTMTTLQIVSNICVGIRNNSVRHSCVCGSCMRVCDLVGRCSLSDLPSSYSVKTLVDILLIDCLVNCAVLCHPWWNWLVPIGQQGTQGTKFMTVSLWSCCWDITLSYLSAPVHHCSVFVIRLR